MAKMDDNDRHRYRALFERLLRLEAIAQERNWEDPAEKTITEKKIEATYRQIYLRGDLREIERSLGEIWSLVFGED